MWRRRGEDNAQKLDTAFWGSKLLPPSGVSMTAIEDSLTEFRSALGELDDKQVLDRFYYGRPALMLPNGADASLRRSVSDLLRVGIRDVLITGSAKLGFTTVDKGERPIFSHFGETSDIDVAVISSALFEKFWKRTLEFAPDDENWKYKSAFRKYLAMGWVRPDKLPISADFVERVEWFEGFRRLTASGNFGPYKITAGVYYDEYFFEAYASRALGKCRYSIENV